MGSDRLGAELMRMRLHNFHFLLCHVCAWPSIATIMQDRVDWN